MRIRSRRLAGIAAAVLALAAAGMASPGAAYASDFRIMAPAAPGGGWDQTARSMQQALQQAGIAGNVQVFNVPGAGGTIGINQFVNSSRSDPTQLMVSGFVMVGALLTNRSAVTLDQVTPIARLTGEWQAVVVPTSSPIASMQDLVQRFKADPGRTTWAGGSAGGVDHVMVGLMAKAAGIDPTKINYVAHSGGGESLAAILSGRVTAGVNSLGEFAGQIETGKMRLLAVSSPQRLPGVNAPTLRETGVDLELANWRMVVAAPGITPEQRRQITAQIERMARSKAWADVLKTRGWQDIFLAGPELDAYIAAENIRVTAILREIGLLR